MERETVRRSPAVSDWLTIARSGNTPGLDEEVAGYVLDLEADLRGFIIDRVNFLAARDDIRQWLKRARARAFTLAAYETLDELGEILDRLDAAIAQRFNSGKGK